MTERCYIRSSGLKAGTVHLVPLTSKYCWTCSSCRCHVIARCVSVLQFYYGCSKLRFQVRIAAQSKLNAMITYFPYSYTVIKPKIIEILQKDSETHHECFKGCLYILCCPKNAPIIARHDWNFTRDIWPLIIRSKPSEKQSIISLINSISDCVHRWVKIRS